MAKMLLPLGASIRSQADRALPLLLRIAPARLPVTTTGAVAERMRESVRETLVFATERRTDEVIVEVCEQVVRLHCRL
jgi:hypothetical protein